MSRNSRKPMEIEARNAEVLQVAEIWRAQRVDKFFRPACRSPGISRAGFPPHKHRIGRGMRELCQ